MTRADERAWYDEFYKQKQFGLAPWYRFTIPDLRKVLKPQSRLVELGCGQGHLLRYLSEQKLLPQENTYGLDQSKTAVDYVQSLLPNAHLVVGDLYQLPYPNDFFDIALLMETIEHLERPSLSLRQIFSVTAPGGLLYVSFPNYLSLPWVPVRILAEKLGKPNWIGLQPIDKIHTVFSVLRLASEAGFHFRRGIGSGYGPPLLYRWEATWMTRSLNALGLWRLCFHPILVFQKPLLQQELGSSAS